MGDLAHRYLQLREQYKFEESFELLENMYKKWDEVGDKNRKWISEEEFRDHLEAAFDRLRILQKMTKEEPALLSYEYFRKDAEMVTDILEGTIFLLAKNRIEIVGELKRSYEREFSDLDLRTSIERLQGLDLSLNLPRNGASGVGE